MTEQDTVKLLRECDAGVKMGTASIDDVLEYVHSGAMRKKLAHCKDEHNQLQQQIRQQLKQHRDSGKDPNPIAKGMSWIKTNMKLSIAQTDATVASLMTDGCNMGVKSLSRYLNQYPAADAYSKDIAKRLIHLEEQLTEDLREYL